MAESQVPKTTDPLPEFAEPNRKVENCHELEANSFAMAYELRGWCFKGGVKFAHMLLRPKFEPLDPTIDDAQMIAKGEGSRDMAQRIKRNVEKQIS